MKRRWSETHFRCICEGYTRTSHLLFFFLWVCVYVSLWTKKRIPHPVPLHSNKSLLYTFCVLLEQKGRGGRENVCWGRTDRGKRKASLFPPLFCSGVRLGLWWWPVFSTTLIVGVHTSFADKPLFPCPLSFCFFSRTHTHAHTISLLFVDSFRFIIYLKCYLLSFLSPSLSPSLPPPSSHLPPSLPFTPFVSVFGSFSPFSFSH